MTYRYHNTTNLSGADLDYCEASAVSQENKILAYFLVAPFITRSPSHLRNEVFDSSVPVTSVRRALSNLTKAGDLVRTDQQVKGPYGRPEYLWKLTTTQLEMFE